MACNFRHGGYVFILLVAVIQVWGNGCTLASGISAKKTIESDDSDTIDCVDIYKQPAFSHPLLKNHVIQWKHSPYFGGPKTRNSSAELFQSWPKNGECPKGTIPILRAPKIFSPRRLPPRTNEQYRRISASDDDPNVYTEYARASLPNDTVWFIPDYYGARGTLNVWIPKVANATSEFSSSEVWVQAGMGYEFNSIEAGWRVKPGDNGARFFIHTYDGNATDCDNLECPGFVQTNHRVALGGILQSVSTYAGKQFEVNISIKMDGRTKDWVLQYQDQVLGYWPNSIFAAGLKKSTNWISFGGAVYNSHPMGHHTTTQMGSGHFPSEGYGKAAYISHIGYVYDGYDFFRDADNLGASSYFPTCYDLRILNSTQLGNHIFFGGPGYSPPQCN